MSGEHVYTFPVELRLSRKIANADEGNRIAALIEEIITNGLEGEGEIADLTALQGVAVTEPVCRHPQEGTIRHMTMEP